MTPRDEPGMGRLTEGVARLVTGIQTARRERERSMRDLAQATIEVIA